MYSDVTPICTLSALISAVLSSKRISEQNTEQHIFALRREVTFSQVPFRDMRTT